ncbi:hypothetical protein [Actinoallomurus acaciae]|uniref:Uncharacterized protein n=1 Tax=Actinoallomurus acaciae TaxID=502577 RepID=A0ABV5YLD2_9ACTN
MPKKPVRSAEAEVSREQRFEREQQAAGAGEQDLRQLTSEEHQKLAALEQRMKTARAEEKTARQKLRKDGKPPQEAEHATGESARSDAGEGPRQTHADDGSSVVPADRAFDSMVRRATAKVEAQEAKAAAAKDAADKASRSPYQVRRDERQREFDESRMSLVCRVGG